jgi:hypothetical protein
MCPTIHGNMLVGPTAEDQPSKTDKSITAEGLASIAADVRNLIPNVQLRDTITQYCGLRPNRVPEGLHFDTWEDLQGYVNLSGVRSTGLTLSLAMGKYVVQQMQYLGCALTLKDNFIKTRKGIVRFKEKIFQHIAPCRKAVQLRLGGGTIPGQLLAQFGHAAVKSGIMSGKVAVIGSFGTCVFHLFLLYGGRIFYFSSSGEYFA